MADGETSFADFEAAVVNDAPVEAPVVAAVEAKAPLELTDDDEAVEVGEGEDGGEEHAEDRKRRSKPAHLRIAEERAKRGEVERERDALRAQLAAKDGPAKQEAADRPDPEQFEFGEADPAYIDALTDWKIDSREASRVKLTQANADRQQFVDRINTGVSGAETTGKAKYADFDAKIEAAVEARGGDPLPPLLTVGIGLSPVGADIIYRLATDDAASARLEKLANGGEGTQRSMAMALGELEGEYMPDGDDADLDIDDTLDMARMVGRMRARMKGSARPVVRQTNAPEPPEQRARGGSGRFAVGADTSDFAAFEKMANSKP